MFNRFLLIVFSFLATGLRLVAQADPAPVESPQRGNTYADDAEVWYQQPILWIGLVIAVLVIVLLMLRRKNAPTTNRLHKY